jgi:hypothetical protein
MKLAGEAVEKIAEVLIHLVKLQYLQEWVPFSSAISNGTLDLPACFLAPG